MKNVDVVALGEILIDFTEAGVSVSGQALYERNAGGAPANVAVAVARLGGTAAFIGKTGPDDLGSFLRRTLADAGVETRGMRVSESLHTTLAFVSLSPGGERSFSFARNPGADTELSAGELDLSLIENARFLHVGSLSLTHEPARSATLRAIAHARASGTFVSYDPNWRAPLWKSIDEGLSAMKSLFPHADLVKVSDAELELLYGLSANKEEDLAAGADRILAEGPRLVLVTLGPRGVYYRVSGHGGFVGVPKVSVVDTTGAGDSFVGGLLYRLSRDGRFGSLDDMAALEADIGFANAVASLCVTRRGAIPAMPTLAETETLLESVRK